MEKTETDPTRRGAARVAGFVLAVVALNVLLRVVPLPDVDLPSIDLPAWLGEAVRIKNWVLGALLALIVVGALIEAVRREADRDG